MSVEIVGRMPDIRRTSEIAHEEAHRAMVLAVEHTRREVEHLAPRGRTGKLGRNLSARATKTATGATGIVRPRELYAPMVEHGTGLRNETGFHKPIMPKHLRKGGGRLGPFMGRGGERLFRRQVKGQKPHPFMEMARTATAPHAMELLERGAEAVTRRLVP